MASTESAKPTSLSQLGVDDDQDGHPGGERGQRRPGTPSREPEQTDRTHRRGPHHARRRPRQDHEPGQRDGADQSGDDRPGPGPPHREQHHADDDRHVGAADRVQVSHPGLPEVLLQGGVEAAGVADDQARQQTTDVVGQRRARPLQPGAQGTGAALRPRGAAAQPRRIMGGQHGGAQITAARRQQPARDRGPLAGQQDPPRGIGTEHQRPRGEPQPRSIDGIHGREIDRDQVRG
nr:hypothetical protein GCM10020092_091870 [Actinoplanes digitatis]